MREGSDSSPSWCGSWGRAHGEMGTAVSPPQQHQVWGEKGSWGWQDPVHPLWGSPPHSFPQLPPCNRMSAMGLGVCVPPPAPAPGNPLIGLMMEAEPLCLQWGGQGEAGRGDAAMGRWELAPLGHPRGCAAAWGCTPQAPPSPRGRGLPSQGRRHEQTVPHLAPSRVNVCSRQLPRQGPAAAGRGF